ncbi:ATP-binding protein [Cystobacter fuscus]
MPSRRRRRGRGARDAAARGLLGGAAHLGLGGPHRPCTPLAHFRAFFSTREGGTGLGLSTAHSIVRAHGGNIRVSSSPQEGTGFLIQLPMRD